MCKTPEEFTLELCKYAQQNHLDLVITKEGMLPEFTIEGIEYTASRSFGRFGATVHCEMKHPEDYMPPEMSKQRSGMSGSEGYAGCVIYAFCRLLLCV